MIAKRILAALFFCITPLLAADYPDTPRVEQTDSYWGVEVQDPYRWLENSEDPLVKAWDNAQKDYYETNQQNNAQKDALYKRMRSLLASEKTETFTIGTDGLLLTSYQDPDQHAPIYYIQNGVGAPLQLVVDVNTWPGVHTVDFLEPSPDGKVIAFGVAQGGDECPLVYLYDTATLQPMEEPLNGRRQSDLVWQPDSSGFYYVAHPKQGEVPPGDEYYWPTAYYHTLGTSSTEDLCILKDDERKEGWVNISEGDAYVYFWRSRRSGLADYIIEGYSQPWGDPRAPLQKIYYKGEGESSYQSIYIGDVEYVLTDSKANNRKLMKSVSGALVDVIPEREDFLETVQGMNGHLAATYCQHGHHAIRIFTTEGKLLQEIPLPGPGVAYLNSQWDNDEVALGYNSLTQPWTLYAYDFGKNTLQEKLHVTIPDYNPEAYETVQVFVPSRDGTPIPLHIARRKGLKQGPTVLSGYGGFNITLHPQFTPSSLPWIQSNGIACIAHLRGGGEYGERWHQGGTRENKQHVFDDFIAAAEMLAHKYATPNTLGIWGGSNGGLLTAAVAVQRPDLFGAVVSAVPLIDMLRYQYFRLGLLWTGEYGSSEVENQFHALHAYSPYHNVVDGASYPATLVTGGLNDFRVDPLHARKMTARLQFADPTGKPHLLQIDPNGGHLSHSHLKQCDRIASELGFLMQQINVKLDEPQWIASKATRKYLFLGELAQAQRQQGFLEEAKNRAMLRTLKKHSKNFTCYPGEISVSCD